MLGPQPCRRRTLRGERWASHGGALPWGRGRDVPCCRSSRRRRSALLRAATARPCGRTIARRVALAAGYPAREVAEAATSARPVLRSGIGAGGGCTPSAAAAVAAGWRAARVTAVASSAASTVAAIASSAAAIASTSAAAAAAPSHEDREEPAPQVGVAAAAVAAAITTPSAATAPPHREARVSRGVVRREATACGSEANQHACVAARATRPSMPRGLARALAGRRGLGGDGRQRGEAAGGEGPRPARSGRLPKARGHQGAALTGEWARPESRGCSRMPRATRWHPKRKAPPHARHKSRSTKQENSPTNGSA